MKLAGRQEAVMLLWLLLVTIQFKMTFKSGAKTNLCALFT